MMVRQHIADLGWRIVALGLIALSVAALDSGAAASRFYFISIGTASLNGVYYSSARSICEIAGDTFRLSGLYCSAEPTPGSVYNVERLSAGELDFALMQSDVQFEASRGVGPWEGRPVSGLRSVMSLYPELLVIVARKDANIEGVGSLRGKRVNIGPPGSGTRASWDELEPALGLVREDLALTAEIPSENATPMLCGNSLDASLWMVGHPSELVRNQLRACDLTIVGGTGPAVEKVMRSRSYLVRGTIPAQQYGLSRNITSFGVTATLVTMENAPFQVVYEFTRAVLGDLKKLQHVQPVFTQVRTEDIAHAAMTAPLHPGAKKAFEELGLIR
jgi:uncharacterized protein